MPAPSGAPPPHARSLRRSSSRSFPRHPVRQYRYMTPEVFKHRKYDKNVDVFSFAMILYEMLEGDPPMVNLESYEAAEHVSEGHRPTFRVQGLLPDLKDLTEQCWAADMNRRPPFLEILKRLEKIKENLPPEHHWGIFNQ